MPYVVVGGAIDLFCTLEGGYTGSGSSSQMYFTYTNSSTVPEVTLAGEYYQLVDERQLRLLLPNATRAGGGFYRCYVGETYVAQVQVYIGRKYTRLRNLRWLKTISILF